ncbi:glycosyltransferase family 4 protein [Vibrio coralliilyticus]|uniref:glycosyltransferase family 4 protein n=1 Tax=Vibrio coralliilyticus TaxID=190893 RepID=UPI00155FCE63|nr:glycosyltransferase family 4 protein [Vibrio coralliilyticus]NRF13564.1 glycosyltransferase family 4 protein [Vibrio coralliilyticus]
MRILLTHYRVGETDGVSLEMDKWKWALEQQGHDVFYMAGSSGSVEAECIDALRYEDELNAKITQDAFIAPTYFESEEALLAAIHGQAEEIATQATAIIEKLDIDVIVPNNIFAVGHSLAAAIGLEKAVENTGVKVVNHHHDFHWEREKFSQPCYPSIQRILDKHFPPQRPQDKHCVINQLANESLKNATSYDSTVVPNVFDFDGCDWKIDDYNQDLRSEFGIREQDIVVLQATRIVARKGIELAVDLIANLQKKLPQWVGKSLYRGQKIESDSRIILVLAGMNEEDEYYDKLKAKAQQMNVELLDINHRIEHSRGDKIGIKQYSLWDAYVHADIVTYPSWLEGWGNQFLEGLVANVPQVVYRYPVYKTDIEHFGFHIIDLGDELSWDDNNLAQVSLQRIGAAAEQTEAYLFDTALRQQHMQENYAIGQKHLSYKALSDILATVF